MVFSVVGIGGLAKTILKSPQKSGILWNADSIRMILSNLYFSLWFFILLLFIFIIIFLCKILEILCVVVAFCFLLFGFFLFWLFWYLGVRFFLVFWFFLFRIFEYENPFNPNYYFCYLSCCCSCLINIIGGERFGCLTNTNTNSDTMKVESFFFL